MNTEQQQQQQPAQPATQTEFDKLLKRPVKFGPKGVDLENLDDVWRFASMVTQSRIAPKGMDTPQAVMIAVAMGAELGLKPMMAIQNIAVINGRPSIWGDAMLALCRQSGLFDEAVFLETGDGQEAVCKVRRKPDGNVIFRKFTMEMAKRAGLLGRKTPWETYPERMLMFRARSWALRDAFGDVLSGLRGAEEERDIPVDEPAEPPVSSLEQLTEKLKEPEPSEALPLSKANDPEPAEPAEDPIADPPFNPPTETEVKEAGAPAISNAERRSEEDRLFRQFGQALADAETTGQVAALIKSLNETNDAGLLEGLDYLALQKEADACNLRLSQ